MCRWFDSGLGHQQLLELWHAFLHDELGDPPSGHVLGNDVVGVLLMPLQTKTVRNLWVGNADLICLSPPRFAEFVLVSN